MFVEILTMYECFLPVAEKLKIPVIGVVPQRSWLYADAAINNPNNPSFIPSTMRPYWKEDNFSERLVNTLNYLLKTFLKVYVIDHFDLADTIPPSLIFFNGHHTLLPRPMNPNMVGIGGIHIQKEKPLPTVRDALPYFIKLEVLRKFLSKLFCVFRKLKNLSMNPIKESY